MFVPLWEQIVVCAQYFDAKHLFTRGGTIIFYKYDRCATPG
jgi:hypothetical protein